MPSCVISCMFFSSNFSPETFLFVPSSPNLLLSFPLIFPSPMRALWSPPSIRISQSSHHSYLLYFSSIFSLSLYSEWGLFAATSFSFPLFTAVVLPISHFLMPLSRSFLQGFFSQYHFGLLWVYNWGEVLCLTQPYHTFLLWCQFRNHNIAPVSGPDVRDNAF